MPVSLISSASATGPGNLTTGSVNTSGASLLIIYVGNYEPGSSPVVSDSKGNTWIPLTIVSIGAFCEGRLYYAENPTVGSGHTFSVTTSVANTLIAAAFSGTQTSSVFDAEGPGNIGGSSATGTNPGPLSTTVDGELVVAGCSMSDLDGSAGGAVTVVDSFTVTDYFTYQAGDHYAGGFAYRVVSTAGTTTNPDFNNSSFGRRMSVMASFLPFSSSQVNQPIVFVIT